MTTIQMFDLRRVGRPSPRGRSGRFAAGDVAHEILVGAPDRGDDDGVDAFTLSKRLRYLDHMAGFDGRRASR